MLHCCSGRKTKCRATGAVKHFFHSLIFKMCVMERVKERKTAYGLLKKLSATAFCLVVNLYLFAQDGTAGINEANTKVRSYFSSGVNLMYAIGAIVGLIGAVKVYQKWNAGDHDTGKVASAWFGSCVFLVVVATVIRSFFGI